jgi:hypothetical protein
MASYFRESRNCELSLLYYLEQSFATDWTGITVLKTFADVYATNQNIPIVVARLAQTNTSRLEVGDSTLDNRYLLIIDIFGRSDSQCLDLSDYIKDKLKDGWVHYDHSHKSGDNTTLDRTANGRDWVTTFVNDTKVDVFGSADEKDRYRHTISVQVRVS